MTKTSTIEHINSTIKVIHSSNSKTVVEGAIKRLSSYGFSKEQISKVLESKTISITRT